MTDQIAALFGNQDSPYYIFTPGWRDSSAGVRALHYLCHALNSNGSSAFLIFSEPKPKNRPRTKGTLRTPELTREIFDSHILSKIRPIVIYSETVVGNPLNADCVVRYVMNFPGALGGPKCFSEDEYLMSYSKNIKLDIQEKFPDRIIKNLFLPAIDPREFETPDQLEENFYLLYAGKYRGFIGSPPTFEERKIVEILRHGKKMQTREELLDLLKRCRGVISLENSSIITEAVLSGKPGLFFPNEFLTSAIAEHELGWSGMAWGIDAEKEFEALSSIQDGQERYFESIEQFHLDLASMVMETQTWAGNTTSILKMRIPKYKYLASQPRIRLAMSILRESGVEVLLKVTINFVKRRLAQYRQHEKMLIRIRPLGK